MANTCTCRPGSSLYCPRCTALAAQAGVSLPGVGVQAPAALAADAEEAAFQDQLYRFCTDLGALYYHTYHSKRSTPGWPDTVIWHHSQPQTLYVWELKAGARQASPAQRRWLDALAQVTSIHAGVYWPKDWPALQALLTGVA